MFARATVGIPVASKKKYRASNEELLRYRNLACLFCQVWPTLSTRLPADEAKLMEKSFAEGSSVDDDFLPFLDSRPSKIALSMLRSRKEEAKNRSRKSSSSFTLKWLSRERLLQLPNGLGFRLP